MADILKKEHFLESRLEDLTRQSNQYYYVTHTDFLDMHEQSIALDFANTLGCYYRMYGGYDIAERRMMFFLPESSYDMDDSQYLSYLSIELPKIGASKRLSHRDYLGALLNIGIERKLIGDLLVSENGCVVICHESIAQFIMDHLFQVGSTSISMTRSNDPSLWQDYTPEFDCVKTTIASNRLDSVVKAGTKLPRTTCHQMIKSGKVFVGGREIKSVSVEVKEGSIISVRGKGKFRLRTIGNLTKKGRLSIEIDIYK